MFCFFGCDRFEHALGNLQERIGDSEIVNFFWGGMQGRKSDKGGDDGGVLACKAKTAAQLRQVIIQFRVLPNFELDVFRRTQEGFGTCEHHLVVYNNIKP